MWIIITVVGNQSYCGGLVTNQLMPRSNYFVFVIIRLCGVYVPIHIIPFSYKNGGISSFFSVHICTKTQRKILVSVRSHYFSAFLKTSVFVNIHFGDRFQKPPFFVVFVQIDVNTITKTEVFLSVFVQKRISVYGAYVYGNYG